MTTYSGWDAALLGHPTDNPNGLVETMFVGETVDGRPFEVDIDDQHVRIFLGREDSAITPDDAEAYAQAILKSVAECRARTAARMERES